MPQGARLAKRDLFGESGAYSIYISIMTFGLGQASRFAEEGRRWVRGKVGEWRGQHLGLVWFVAGGG